MFYFSSCGDLEEVMGTIESFSPKFIELDRELFFLFVVYYFLLEDQKPMLGVGSSGSKTNQLLSLEVLLIIIIRQCHNHGFLFLFEEEVVLVATCHNFSVFLIILINFNHFFTLLKINAHVSLK